MPRIPVLMPTLGEGIYEARVVALPFEIGDTIEEDREVIEVETKKAVLGVTSPCRGELAEICVGVGQTRTVGEVLLWLRSSDGDARRPPSGVPAAPNRRWWPGQIRYEDLQDFLHPGDSDSSSGHSSEEPDSRA